MSTLDQLVIASFIAVNIDMMLQARRIYYTKSSEDLSLIGMTIRYVAIVIVFFKFVSIHSTPLIIGQGLTALSFTVYFTLAATYFWRRKRFERSRTQKYQTPAVMYESKS